MSGRILVFLLLTTFSKVTNGALIRYPQDVSSTVGSTVQFVCGTSEFDVPVNWIFERSGSRDVVRIYSSGTLSAEFMQRFTVKSFEENEYTLIIEKTQVNDTGRYKCVDDAGLGEVASAELIVRDIDTPITSSTTVASKLLSESSSTANLTVILAVVLTFAPTFLIAAVTIGMILLCRFKLRKIKGLHNELEQPMLEQSTPALSPEPILGQPPWAELKRKELNILLLGEAGVGKSTWINGFVNYFTHRELDRVASVIIVLPIKYTVTDQNCKAQIISLGTNTNASCKDGSSAENEKDQPVPGQSTTQMPKTYEFAFDDVRIRLIDTPGFGDARGSNQDDTNFENIMEHIKQYNEIHGICVLLKPNSARLNITFEALIDKLLKKFGKASDNIVFCFTHTRSTLYRPGDTYAALTNILDDMKKKNKEAKIELGVNTVYCTDNEAIRYLAALRCGISFDDEEKQYMKNSWKKSLEENKRLLKYLSSLKPYVVNTDQCRLTHPTSGEKYVPKPPQKMGWEYQKPPLPHFPRIGVRWISTPLILIN